MNLVKNVYNISESFMKDAAYVNVNYEKIESLAADMITTNPPKFPIHEEKNIFKGVVMELVAASVNYCYWYGKSNIRPNGANSTFMYENLINAFFDYEKEDANLLSLCVARFIGLLMINRFPLIEERIKHCGQIRIMGERFCKLIIEEHDKHNINRFMNELIVLFPGFGSDIFLKRASLFFIQLYRCFGWFENQLSELHVPADYQVPKMLEHFKCITYTPYLKNIIEDNKLIAKHSIEECEIRSATVIAIRKLCELTKWNVAQVDGYFFLKRNSTTTPFHLTITTDY